MSSSKLQSALLGALVYAVLAIIVAIFTEGGMSMPTVGAVFSCLVAILAPITAVWHYTNTNSLTLPAGEGAGLGALASAIGAVIAGIFSFILRGIGLLPSMDEVFEMQREQMLSQGMTPEQIDQAMGWAGMFANPLVALLVSIVIGAIVGAIVGAVAALIFKKGEEEDLVI